MPITFNSKKKLFLLDQDGTLYKGGFLFPYTVPFLQRIKDMGASYLFITNNSSKSISEYVLKMHNFGIVATESDFYTSSSATIDYIKTYHKEEPVYLVGTMALSREFIKNGINLTEDKAKAKVAVLSYDTELNYSKLTALCDILRNPDVTYLATNPDLVCPTESGYLPDCGSFAILIDNAVGRKPLFLGKPRSVFMESILNHYRLRPEDVVVVGDRLYTDIALGVNSGVDSVLVLTGEAKIEDLNTSSFQPTYVVNSIDDIL